jgi:hypothetical protein
VTWHEVRGRNSDQNEAAQVAASPHHARHVRHGGHPHEHTLHPGVFALAAGTPGAGSREGEVMKYLCAIVTKSLFVVNDNLDLSILGEVA